MAAFQNRLQERAGTGAESYADFKEQYWTDPVGFVRDCVRFNRSEGPTAYQDETLGELPQPVVAGELRATYAPKAHSADAADFDADTTYTDDESHAPTDGVEE